MSNNSINKRKPPMIQPLYVKVNALRELKNGVDENVIANNLNVHLRTVREWKKKEEEILELQREVEGMIPKESKRAKKIRCENLDKTLWEWFKEQRNSGLALDVPSIKKQALEFYQTLGFGAEKFLASSSWMQKFRHRHRIFSLITTSEKNSFDAVSAENFIPFFADYIHAKNLSEHQVFNCAQIGLNYKSMPEIILNDRSLGDGFNHQRKRLAVMACSNASGLLKLPLVIVDKYSESRSRKILKSSDKLPVYYRNHKHAWINSRIFNDWFHNEFVPKVIKFLELMELPLKAVLILENCMSYPKELQEEEAIKTYYFPPNTTALIQPMDQGILKCFKSKYRQKMMQNAVNWLDNGKELAECIENVDFENVIPWIVESWNEVSFSIITEAWKHLWPDEMNQKMVTEVDNSGVSNDTISKFITLLQGVPCYRNILYKDLYEWLYPSTIMTPDEALTNEDIVQIVRDEMGDDKKDFNDDNDGDSSCTENCDGNNCNGNNCNVDNSNDNHDGVTREEAREALKIVISYCESQQSPFFTEKLVHLYQLQEALNNDDFEDFKSIIVGT